jgi:ABC-2 type transport system permease protein
MATLRPALAVVVRLLAFMGKELTETLRRPGAIVSLILGPFLIMAVFGLGYDGAKRPLETIVVAPPSSGLPADVESYQELAGGGLHIDEVTADRAAAEARLVAGTADVVIVAPEDPESRFRAGEQSPIEVIIDTVDPVAYNYAGFLAAGLASEVNREIIERAAEETQGYAVAAGEPDAAAIPPDVVAAPTRAELRNAAPSEPGVIAYFGPAVLALILQHLAVTLVALSLVRERTSGVIELFRVAPVSTTEVLVGKVLAFGFIGSAIAALTVVLLVGVFDVPFLADPAPVAGVIGLLLVASLGLGLLIAVVSDSERQAVQLSLLVLLASVFFSGFVLAIEEFTEPVRAIAYALPVTHGIRLLQDLMLRGSTTEVWEALALGVIAGVTLIASWALLRRSMTRA